MIMQFLKSTLTPLESVRMPSSRIWRRMLNTSGCAFSISSKSTTLLGLCLTASVNCPPSSYPTYPGGEPVKRLAAIFSIYSDISSLIRYLVSPQYCFANCLVSSVLPTPVGPTNRKDPIGLFGSLIPALLRLIAFTTPSMALSCPMIALCRLLSRSSILLLLVLSISATSTPLNLLMVSRISSIDASQISPLFPAFRRAAVSSMTLMALSGSLRFVIYLSLRTTAALSTLSLNLQL